MRLSKSAVLLLVIQTLLVSSIAGKYLYERKVCPRVWTRAAQVDPDSPLRGRYLVLPLRVDACGLPKEVSEGAPLPMAPASVGDNKNWNIDVIARQGHLVGVENHTPAGGDHLTVWLPKNTACDRAVLRPGTELYIPELAKLQPLQPGEELWVEVTVPPAGPPRAIQLAVSGNGNFTPIKFK